MISIGTSGYYYKDWKGVFYPSNLPQSKWLEYYSQNFSTVELNITFYKLPKKSTFENWYKTTPPNFSFFIKGSRYITHIKRLHNVEKPLLKQLKLTAILKKKLAGILWQFPSNLKFDKELFENFLINLKKAEKQFGKIRHAFEFRNVSWFNEITYKTLSHYKNCTIVLADWPFRITIKEKKSIKSKKVMPTNNIIKIPISSNFIYIRLHGPTILYASYYSEKELKKIVQTIKQNNNKDLFVYFNNDFFGFAIQNAKELKRILKKDIL